MTTLEKILEEHEQEEAAKEGRILATALELFDALRALTEHDEALIEAGVLRHFIEVEQARRLLDRIIGKR